MNGRSKRTREPEPVPVCVSASTFVLAEISSSGLLAACSKGQAEQAHAEHGIGRWLGNARRDAAEGHIVEHDLVGGTREADRQRGACKGNSGGPERAEPGTVPGAGTAIGRQIESREQSASTAASIPSKLTDMTAALAEPAAHASTAAAANTWREIFMVSFLEGVVASATAAESGLVLTLREKSRSNGCDWTPPVRGGYSKLGGNFRHRFTSAKKRRRGGVF